MYKFLRVTGLATSFCLVSPKAELKKCEAYFFKRQKAAAFPLPNEPAVEAKNKKLKLTFKYKAYMLNIPDPAILRN